MVDIGWWSGDMRSHEALVARVGRKPEMFRSRVGEGQFNAGSSWYHEESRAAMAAGGIPSLQFQPKRGDGPQRRGVGVERIIAGQFDAFILEKLEPLADIPIGTRVPFEVVSEANIQNDGPVGAQPLLAGYNPGTDACTREMTAAEYIQLLRKVDALARTAGVRNRLWFVVSLTHGKWNSGSTSDPWSGASLAKSLAPLTTGKPKVVNMIAADGYYGGRYSTKNTPALIASGVRRTAAQLGVMWSVMETGAAATVGAAAKDRWFRDWIAQADDRCAVIFHNVEREQDADELDFRPDAPAGALPGFVAMMDAIQAQGA